MKQDRNRSDEYR